MKALNITGLVNKQRFTKDLFHDFETNHAFFFLREREVQL